MISWNLKTRNVRPIGLDIGHSSIKMIQLAASGERISVLAADKARIDPNVNDDAQARRRDIVSAVKQMLARGGFQGRDVVSCLPNDKLNITSLRISEMEFDHLANVLRKEVVQRFGLDPDKDAMDHVVAGTVHQGDETKNELILFAVDDETIREHIDMLEELHLQPVAIDTVPCALFRGYERWQRREADKENTIVFVDIGSRFTTVVFGRGGEISFVKQIAIGGRRFAQEVSDKLSIPISEAERLRERIGIERGSNAWRPRAAEQTDGDTASELDASTRQVVVDAVSSVAEELAREISLCLRYFTVTFRGKRVERVVFSGGEAHEGILLNVLRRHLSVEIVIAEPLKGFDLSTERKNINLAGDRRGMLCEWAVAVGLGLKGLNETAVGVKA
ncbi:MAG: pilus assembly protein PilM [Sedimentisphaerales bacterium]|nr:pilus assembly protein PilM [Sedimentisphaerales bacterium]